jgi:hypothetical protein
MQKELEPRFDWGEAVRIRATPHLPERAGSVAEVCGVEVIRSPEHAKRVIGGSVGSTAYLIEFGDGSSIEIVGELLEPQPQQSQPG